MNSSEPKRRRPAEALFGDVCACLNCPLRHGVHEDGSVDDIRRVFSDESLQYLRTHYHFLPLSCAAAAAAAAKPSADVAFASLRSLVVKGWWFPHGVPADVEHLSENAPSPADVDVGVSSPFTPAGQRVPTPPCVRIPSPSQQASPPIVIALKIGVETGALAAASECMALAMLADRPGAAATAADAMADAAADVRDTSDAPHKRSRIGAAAAVPGCKVPPLLFYTIRSKHDVPAPPLSPVRMCVLGTPWYPQCLFDMLADGGTRLSRQLAWKVVRTCAATLLQAQQLGWTHCDLKPENVFVCRDEPVLADWNSCRPVTDAPHTWGLHPSASTPALVSALAAPSKYFGSKAGTKAFNPPSRLSATTAQSDVFRLGGLMYCMLFRCPPAYAPSHPCTIEVFPHVPESSAELVADTAYLSLMLGLLLGNGTVIKVTPERFAAYRMPYDDNVSLEAALARANAALGTAAS